MNAAVDLLNLTVGLALAVVSGFFLLSDDPSMNDVATVLLPLMLLVGGAALLLGSIRRSRRDPAEP